MSLEIVLIPLSVINEPSAHELFNKIKSCVKKEINLIIDTSYFASLKTRISKHRRKNKDIVIIDNFYDKNQTITLRFSGVANNPTQLPVEELIELITTLEDEEEEEEEEKNAEKENISNSEPPK